MKNQKPFGFSSVVWISILIFYLTLRLFSGYSYNSIGGDTCTYLTLARNFPYHLLYNHDLYLIHSPLFGYIVGLYAFFLPLVQAGYLVNITFYIAIFFALKKLGEAFDLSPSAIAFSLFVLGISKSTVVYFTGIGRMPLLLFFYLLSFIYFLSFLKDKENRFPTRCFIFTGLALWTSDQALALFPCLFVLLLWKGDRSKWKLFFRFSIYSGLIYLAWPLVRLGVYATHTFYPTGSDGLVEAVSAGDWASIVQPNYLNYTEYYRSFFTPTRFSLQNLDWRELWTMPFSLLFIPKWLSKVGIVLFLLPAFYVFFKKKDRDVWVFLLLGLFLYLPCLFGMHDWYGLGYIIPFSLLIGKSWDLLSKKNYRLDFMSGLVIIIVSLFLSGFWIFHEFENRGAHHYRPIGGKHLIFSRTPVTRGMRFAKEVLSSLPGDGFMSPVGLTPELVYLTGKRFIALPFDPGQLESLIHLYDIKYFIFSNENLHVTKNKNWDLANSRVVSNYIQNHKERFEFVVAFKETYPDYFPPNTFYLYRLVSWNSGSFPGELAGDG